MKKFFLTFCATVITLTTLFAQAPEVFQYQAIARDASGDPLVNQQITPRFTILQGSTSGTVVYDEDHALPGPVITTNENGLFTAEIGSGFVLFGPFSIIDWSNGPYFLQVGLDPTGGLSYVTIGTQQLLSVPFALHAKSADSVTNDQVDDADADPTNELQTISRTGTTVTLDNGGGTFQDSVGVYTAGTNINISGGNTINQTTNMHPFNTINFMICISGVFPNTGPGFDNATIGEIKMFAGNFTPSNWAFCDGQLLAISTNTALFSVIGTLYGGNGTSTFALPDLRGRSPLHEGNGPGLTPRNLGQKNGVE